MTDTILELCRAVKYTPNPNGRKGSRKCGECGFFFVPNDVVYSFHNPGLFEDIEYHTGREWHEKQGCCPNCWPKGPGLTLGGRRCLGKRNGQGRWQRNLGCGEWFSIPVRQRLGNERTKQCRAQMCWGCSQDSGLGSKIDWEAVGDYIRTLADDLGRAPTRDEWRDKRRRDMPSDHAIRSRFGNYNPFIIWCGLEPRKPGGQGTHGFKRRYSTRKILGLMREIGKEYGRAISKSEWSALSLDVSVGAIARRFGEAGRSNGWRNAWRRLGYEPLPDPHKDTPRRQTHLAAICEKSLQARERRRRELEELTARKLNEMLAAHQRFEDAKFRGAND